MPNCLRRILQVLVFIGLSSPSLFAQTRLEVEVLLPPEMTFQTPTSWVDQETCQPATNEWKPPLPGERLEEFTAWLEAQDSEAPSAQDLKTTEPHRVIIQACRAQPHLVFLKPGESLRLQSQDPISYDLVIRGSETGRRRRLLPPNLEYVQLPFQRKEVAEIRSELHPQLRLLVVVTPDSFRAQARTGRAQFDSVPPGSYRLFLWHPILGMVRDRSVLELHERRVQHQMTWPNP